ncbi:MAG: Uma2 family endonuclease [Lachnospiraceae bacterium]|nr:Uma2 family endonuclease [Lachnospiraceae bacterium]
MMTLEEMKKAKEEYGFSCEEISKRTGVPYRTVQKIFTGKTEVPRGVTLERLYLLFNEQTLRHNSYEKVYLDPDGYPRVNVLREPEFAYDTGRPQGKYTVQDLENFPSWDRVELIDGEIIHLEAPTTVHQAAVSELFFQFYGFVAQKGGDCKVFAAPIDVQFDNAHGKKDSFQPDLLVVCDPKKVTRKNIQGAPDLCVEVLSPSTRRRDCTLKLGKYLYAGVREYWVLDVEKGRLAVYTQKDVFPVVYRKGDLVPVSIYDGELKIDLSKIPWFGEEEEA